MTPGVLSAVSATPTIPDDDRRPAARRSPSGSPTPENPLTARVMVNRVWQWTLRHAALAGNPNNFGATGKKPTHPELLDWLAAEFVERRLVGQGDCTG